MEAVRVAAVHHDMTQGFVLTQYFYEQLVQFEKDPVGLRDTIGEMVYGMDIDQQIHRARQTEFDKKADEDVLHRSKPRVLTGLDLAGSKASPQGDIATASAMARQALAVHSDSLESVSQEARDRLHPRSRRHHDRTSRYVAMDDRFQKTIAISKEPRLLAWSHIYLGRMLDLDCRRDQALTEYQQALAVRDGQQDTRLAAERGVKAAYAVKGHSCDDDADDSAPPAKPGAAPGQPTAPNAQ